MKKFVSLLLVLCMIIGLAPALSGCGVNHDFKAPEYYADLPDTYVEGADYQNTFSVGSGGPFITPADGGYYFLSGNYLCFLDGETLDAVPVCNRPDCQHNDTSCNAYFDVGWLPFIQAYEGDLFISTQTSENGGMSAELYVVDPDTCKREKICKIPHAFGSNYWQYMLHRGYLYILYLNSGIQYLERVILDGVEEEPEAERIWEGKCTMPISSDYPIGNHFIFQSFKEEEEDFDGTLFDYNLITGEIKSISAPAEYGEGPFAYSDNMYENSILFHMGTLEELEFKTHEGENRFYQYDLSDRSAELFYTAKDRGDGMHSFLYFDGKHFIEKRVEFPDNEDPSITEKQSVSLLDENLNVIDTLVIGNPGTGDCAGDEKFSFFYDTETGELRVLDKRSEKLSLKTVWPKDGT